MRLSQMCFADAENGGSFRRGAMPLPSPNERFVPVPLLYFSVLLVSLPCRRNDERLDSCHRLCYAIAPPFRAEPLRPEAEMCHADLCELTNLYGLNLRFIDAAHAAASPHFCFTSDDVPPPDKISLPRFKMFFAAFKSRSNSTPH